MTFSAYNHNSGFVASPWWTLLMGGFLPQRITLSCRLSLLGVLLCALSSRESSAPDILSAKEGQEPDVNSAHFSIDQARGYRSRQRYHGGRVPQG